MCGCGSTDCCCCPTVCCASTTSGLSSFCPTAGVYGNAVLLTPITPVVPGVTTAVSPIGLVGSNFINLSGSSFFTVPVAGRYTIRASPFFTLSGPATQAFTTSTIIQVNGVPTTLTSPTFPIGTSGTINAPVMSNTTSPQFDLVPGDLVNMAVLITSPGTPSVTLSNATTFSILSSC